MADYVPKRIPPPWEDTWRGPFRVPAPGTAVPPPPAPTMPGWTPEPKGCICPPGAEATCQRSDCGRRDHGTPAPVQQ